MKLTVFTLLCYFSVALAQKKVVCYYGTWATYRPAYGKFDVTDIDPHLCTHIMYAFFGIETTGDIRVIDAYLDLEENYGKGNVKKFNNLKNVNPNLKTFAAVGGWNEGSHKFSIVANDPAKRKHFAVSAVQFIKRHGFDGLDLDWEYPAQRDGDPKIDRENYILLLKDVKQELDRYGLQLSAAVASAEFSAALSYNIPEVVKYLDFINVMAYDLHGSWENTTGINAPLYAGSNDVTIKERQLNANASIQYWIKQGAPASKIILGLPFYGRTFTLSDSSKNSIGSPVIGPGTAGQYSREPGMIGYNEFCEKLKTETWTIKWEEQQKVPYAYRDRQWVGYDNLQSIELKAKYVNEQNLGGVMMWSLETDDFRGICGTRYALLRKLNDIVRPNAPTQPPASSTTPSTSTTPSGNVFQCTSDGVFRDPQDCSVYHLCLNGRDYRFECPKGLLFDPKTGNCNYAEYVDCNQVFNLL